MEGGDLRHSRRLSIALHGGTDPFGFFRSGLAYEQKADPAQAEQNLARGTNLASKVGTSNDAKMPQAEAAKGLGKPKPALLTPVKYARHIVPDNCGVSSKYRAGEDSS